jgi:hypothetical protein
MGRKLLWSGLALLPLLAVAAWYGMGYANATSPAKPPAGKLTCCCDDPTCPPGCTPECAAECLPAAKVNTAAKAERCCPEGESCPECCAQSSKTTKAAAKAPQKKYTCPPCPFCPGW